MQEVISLKDIRKSYFLGRQELPVLKGINMLIKRNEYLALMGPSGSGKSTLMNILGCLDTPTSGRCLKKLTCLIFVLFLLPNEQEIILHRDIFISGLACIVRRIL